MALNVTGRSCLVVGSDREAMEKTQKLLESGAKVTLVAPDLSQDRMDQLKLLGAKFLPRTFKLADLTDQFLVMFSIKDDQVLTKSVAKTCRKKRILLCAIDQAAYCDVVNMSLYERGPLKIAISTDAISPALAKKMRLGFESSLKDFPVEEFMESLRILREQVGKNSSDPAQRMERLTAAVKDVSFHVSLNIPARNKK